MSFSSIFRSSDFGAFLLWFVLSGFCRIFGCGFISVYGTLAVSLYYLYEIFSSKKIEGGEKWKVVIIGAGMSGLNAAKKLKDAGIPFVVLEKAQQLGGTWWYNRYPGAACDVPSHLYSLSYYLNPWWSRAYSKHTEIENYLLDFAKTFGLFDYIKFNVRVSKCDWNEKTHKWTVTTEKGDKHECNFIFSGIGALHTPNKPNFKGQEQFKGQIIHSAEWPEKVNLKNKKVLLIGTGASAVQIVPNIASEVKDLHVFQRTPCWVPARQDYEFPDWVKKMFSIFPSTMLLLRWFIFWRNEFRFHLIFNSNRKLTSNYAQGLLKKEMKSMINDPEVAEKLIPKYPLGCKRVTPSDTYLKAFNRPNVHLVTDPIDCLTPKGVKSKSGKEFEADVIILATGFSIMDSCNSYEVTGRGKRVLQKEWSDEPRLFLGSSHPAFPNLFFVLGPGTGLGHSSIIYVIECQTNYAIDAVKKLIRAGYKSMECKEERFNWYQELTKSMMTNKVFRGGGGCFAWYQNERGVNWTLWPGDLSYFWWLTKECVMGDYLVR